ncbi:putative translation elongation factor Tu [Trichuris suis]|nr:putative translation elongation factor Tu [Trichuris suis]
MIPGIMYCSQTLLRKAAFAAKLLQSSEPLFQSFKCVTCSRYFCTTSREKGNFNVGTIGHIDHGKTTLTSAITKVLSERSASTKFTPFELIDKAPEERQRGITITIAHVGYESDVRKYAHTDCPGHKDFIKNMICGTTQMDAAILVVDAAEGVMPQTKEHLMLAKQIGVERIVAFINKADKTDQEVLELVQIEVRELLSEYGYDSDSLPVIVGSALLALNGVDTEYGVQSILRLVAELDKLPMPARDSDSSVLLPVSSAFTVTGRGTVVVGTMVSGVLRKGGKVQVVGQGKFMDTVVSDLHIFRESVKEIRAGDHAGVLCRHLRASDVERGMWLVSPNTTPLCNYFRAEGYFLKKDESGVELPPLRDGFTQKLMCTTWDQTCRIILPAETSMVMQGEDFAMKAILLRPMPLRNGLRFTVMMGKHTIINGVVSELYNNLPIYSLKDTKDAAEKVK